MSNNPKRASRRGVPAWIYAASIGLALLALTAIVVRSASDPGDTEDNVVVADDDGPEVDAPAETPTKRPAILMSMATSIPRVEPKEIVATPRRGSVERAKAEIAGCLERYQKIQDYTCVFHKRERIHGHMIAPHIMEMKVRTQPVASIYFKFHQPNRGREAIFVPGKNNGKIIAHDVGLVKVLAGTMILDPKGTMAMDESRHPITDAGLGALIHTIADRWSAELDPSESDVAIHEHAKVGDRSCLMIETTHASQRPAFLFHKVKVFIDHQSGLPIRFEAYDWPRTPGVEAELVEEYTYADLKTDVGLTDADFDPANPRYSFGRF